MKKSLRILSLLSLLMFSLFTGGTGPTGAKPLTEAGVKAKWKIIASLEKKQQYNAAIPYVEEILAHAQTKGDAPLWAKALARRVVLENALHGAGTSVKLLLETPWPKDPKYQAILNLYTARTLFNYYQTYAWEVNQREKTAAETDFNDFKKWTSQQIFEAANRRYELAWQYRELMGQEKVSAYADYFTAGNYPGAIRKTLRDLIVYEWIDFLKNTTTWSPEQAQEKYKLSLASFLAQAPAGNQPALDLKSPQVHPLEKINCLLNDHYQWYQASGQRESCLEARLVKLECLTPHFTKPQEIADIGRAYQELLSQYSDVSWWAHGQYQYASFIQSQGDLVTAHQVSENGYKKYPNSIGGKECLALMKAIEAPAFSFRVMANDRNRVRSAQISHRNLNRLYFRIYRIDPAALTPAKGLPLVFNNTDEIKRRIFQKKPEAAWESSLPDPGDYQTHQSYETLPVPSGPEGLYLIAVSANRDFSQTKNQVLVSTFCLSSLVIVTSQQPREGNLEVWVWDGKSGMAVPGAKVTLYQYHYQDQPRIQQAVTDDHGLATFSERELDSNYYYNNLLTAEKGARFTILKDGVYLQGREPVEDNIKQAFVYTDRAIYRPLQKVYYKIVAFEGNPPRNEYQTVSGQQLTVSFTDPNGETVASQTVTTNSFGSASGEFQIPSGRILGYYRLVVDGWGEAGIRVEEYKRPTFEAKLPPPDDALRLNHDVVLKGEAVYYFGMPVTEGRVNYRITRETDYPWWYFRRYSWITRQPAREVAAGETSLNGKGEFQIHFRPEGDETLPDKEGVSYRFRVAATITDSGGETKEAVRDYLIGFTAISATITAAQNFYHAGDAVACEVSRTNLEGVGQAGAGKYELYLLKQPEETQRAAEIPILLGQGKHTPGDSLRPRWEEGEGLSNTLFRWEDGPLVRAGELTHDQTGRGAITFSGLKPGAYRLRYQTRDKWGAICRAQKELVVAAAGMALRASHYLLPLKQQVSVGQSLPVLIGTGFQNKPWVFEVWLGDELARREYRYSDGAPELLQLPIDGQMRGGFTLRLYLVEDYQVYQAEAWVAVPFDNKQLEVNFSTFRDLLRPGQKETWSLAVKGPDREITTAELLAYMYDRSLDYFGAHQDPNPATLYQRWGYRPALTANLSANSGYRISAHPWFSLPAPPSLSDNRLILYPGYPAGGLGGRRGVMPQSEADGASFGYKAVPAPVMAAPLGPLMKDGITDNAKDEYTGRGDSRAVGQTPSSQTEAPLRSDFAETAFFYPHLLTGADGLVKIEFEVPDTVTSWNVFVHALTRDLKFMTLERQTETRKELMARPYLPRFFREGDSAALKVVVNNAGKEALTGEATLEIYDPETNEPCLGDFQLTKSAAVQKWSASAGESATLTWKLTAPNKIKTYAFKVMARTSQMSDGEVRPVPVLPSRLHLAQSKFGVLKDDDLRVLKIEDLEKAAGPSLQNERLVVTLDGQLIYTVLRALPYLANYPYECMEQTLNRFLSTSIVGSLYAQYPPLAKMAQDFSSRKTRIEPWVLDDPNRKLALEETPWLQDAKGGPSGEADLINLFDSRVVQANQKRALQKLQQAQLPSGGFPWFEGGPASDYMTLYILYGLAKAREYDVTVPEEMVRRAWQYLRAQYDQYYAAGKLSDDYYFSGFLNYVASCFPESYYAGSFPKSERTAILNRCFKRWTGFNPYAKALLALTLYRAGRTQDAKMVLASIMDSAITKPDQGTFWAREDRSWLWYNDQIESHAFILRALLEIDPEDPRLDGLALWLLLNKKMNQWKSTRTTAEVIYSLAKYMKHTGSLAVREEANVAIGGQNYSFVFEPDQYTGARNQLVFEGAQVKPGQMAAATVSKKGKGFMFASMAWSYSTETPPAEDKGSVLSIKRAYYLRSNVGGQYVLTPLAEGAKVQVGDQIEVQLSITCRNPMEYVHLHDPRAAGLEPECPVSGHHWDLGLYWYEESRDSGANFFFERLPQGEYSFKYRLRANMAGVFRSGPATIQSMYAPEFAAFSAGQTLKIGE
ncbi:MAG: hypothetical protein K6U80_16145 [Firmicutes bacterium]|nr:hypothetical protein [Bacillota bacterium]